MRVRSDAPVGAFIAITTLEKRSVTRSVYWYIVIGKRRLATSTKELGFTEVT